MGSESGCQLLEEPDTLFDGLARSETVQLVQRTDRPSEVGLPSDEIRAIAGYSTASGEVVYVKGDAWLRLFRAVDC